MNRLIVLAIWALVCSIFAKHVETTEDMADTAATKRFVSTFLKGYCADVGGDYNVCRQCVAVGCLRVMDGPIYTGQYEDCIEVHNRCCSRGGGVTVENTALTGKCYATGWISEVGFGQLSVAKTGLGMQAKDKQFE